MRFLLDNALLIGRTLAIADLHLGLEKSFGERGVSIPPQTKNLEGRIEKLVRETGAKRIVFVGDFKDKVVGVGKWEQREIPEFLWRLQRKVKVSIVKGNHDGNLELVTPGWVRIYGSEGFREGKTGFAHGHAWVSEDILKAERVVLGDLHPAIEFVDGKSRAVEQVWVRCAVNRKFLEKRYGRKTRLREAVIIPAFNRLTGSAPINRRGFRLERPLGKFLDWKNGEVFLTDGTFLGKLKELID